MIKGGFQDFETIGIASVLSLKGCKARIFKSSLGT